MTSPWPLFDPLLVDRAAHRRELDMADAVAVVVDNGAVLAEQGRLVELAPDDRPEAELTVYLGECDGRDFVAVVPLDKGFRSEAMVGLRELVRAAAQRGDEGLRDRELAATAVAITTWHANHGRCASCGEPTVPAKGGWVRACAAESKEHYPRTDPAVIVAITDDDDRLLIAHASYWSAGRYSHLAGYVEPGESLEQAARREVAEEVGIGLGDLTYVASQPWPFPASVMVGFRAVAASTEFTLDQDEITDARWVTREELSALEADGTVVLPPAGSIARWMLDDWRA